MARLDAAGLHQNRRPIVDFTVEELGGEVPLRALSMTDVLEVQGIEDVTEKVFEFLRRALVDDDGKPMFDRERFLEVMGGWPISAVHKISDKVNEMTGTQPGAVEAAKGN